MIDQLAAPSVGLAVVLVLAGFLNPTDATLQAFPTLTARDCVETTTHGSVETNRGSKTGESMGFAVKTYKCRKVDTSEVPANVQDLPWESDRTPADTSTGTSSSEPIPINSQECQWFAIESPPADDPRWEGNDSSTGAVIANDCNGPTVYQFMAGPAVGGPTALPPPTPEELAEQAYNEISIPKPTVGAGPDRTKLAVNLWTWLWIDDPGTQTVTIAAGGISITAVATLTSTTWSLGEPAPTGGPYTPGPAVTITCQGTGTAPSANYDWKAEPPCGHKYTWMSAKDRTNGSGKWPITATSNWNVTWQSNTGVSGSTVLNASSTDALEIGEYRVVLVQDDGG